MEASAESGVNVAPTQYELGSAASIILLGASFKAAPIGFRERFAAQLLSNGGSGSRSTRPASWRAR